jgi:hypothetical protein
MGTSLPSTLPTSSTANYRISAIRSQRNFAIFWRITLAYNPPTPPCYDLEDRKPLKKKELQQLTLSETLSRNLSGGDEQP